MQCDSRLQCLSDIMTITLRQNRPKSGTMTVPKFHFITLELLPYDNYRPVTIFGPCPEVVTISNNYCSAALNQSQPNQSPPCNKLLPSSPSGRGRPCSAGPASPASRRPPCSPRCRHQSTSHHWPEGDKIQLNILKCSNFTFLI